MIIYRIFRLIITLVTLILIMVDSSLCLSNIVNSNMSITTLTFAVISILTTADFFLVSWLPLWVYLLIIFALATVAAALRISSNSITLPAKCLAILLILMIVLLLIFVFQILAGLMLSKGTERTTEPRPVRYCRARDSHCVKKMEDGRWEREDLYLTRT